MLEDYDEDWVNADQTRMAKYADVPSGTYTFKVKAFVIDSPDKFDMREIEVEVPAPFFMSQNSIWLYMIIGVIIVALFMFWRQSCIKKRHKQTRKKAEDLKEAELRKDEDQKFMAILNEWMNDHYAERRIDVNEILKMLSMSLSDFEDNIKRITGFSPKEFIYDYRLGKSQQFLQDTDADADEIAKQVGFRDAELYLRLFHEKYGILPNEYRARYRESQAYNDSAYEEIKE
jgi:AraC-like DNA-binding protein